MNHARLFVNLDAIERASLIAILLPLKREESFASMKVQMAFCFRQRGGLNEVTFLRFYSHHLVTNQSYWRSAGQPFQVGHRNIIRSGVVAYSLVKRFAS